MGDLAAADGPRVWKIGRYTFQHEFIQKDKHRTWSCGVVHGPVGALGAGGCKTAWGAFLSCRSFEREIAARRLENA